MATGSYIGKSKHAEQLRKLIATLAASRKDALIVGEAGTGKSTVADHIAGGELLAIFDLVAQHELELQTALSNISSGSVLFENLQEAGFRVQNAVLTFIEHRPKNVRIMATLSTATKELLLLRKLSESLCARINGFEQIEIRPLRERPEDIPLLVKHFARGLTIDINTLDTLVNLQWKGNIRQLKSVIEQCISGATDGKFVLPDELVDERTEVAKMVSGLMESQKSVLDKSLDVMENTIIRRTLERFGFDESQSAEFLGMTEQTFGQKLKRLSIAKINFR